MTHAEKVLAIAEQYDMSAAACAALNDVAVEMFDAASARLIDSLRLDSLADTDNLFITHSAASGWQIGTALGNGSFISAAAKSLREVIDAINEERGK